MVCHHAGLDDEQTRDVIGAMSRREVQPDEIIIRSSTCPIALSKQQQPSLVYLAKRMPIFQPQQPDRCCKLQRCSQEAFRSRF